MRGDWASEDSSDRWSSSLSEISGGVFRLRVDTRADDDDGLYVLVFLERVVWEDPENGMFFRKMSQIITEPKAQKRHTALSRVCGCFPFFLNDFTHRLR